jgi:Protein of unknown function (DUF2887)
MDYSNAVTYQMRSLDKIVNLKVNCGKIHFEKFQDTEKQKNQTTVKTDSIFYRLFQEFPSIFFELIERPPETANLYQFSSVEVKQTAFRIDGVFLPIQNEDNPIYFVEVQFQPDLDIYSRIISEVFLYLRQN